MTPEEFRKIPFADLYRLKEDDRIKLIAHHVMEHRLIVGFLTDSGPGDEGKATRYCEKLLRWFPDVEVISIEPGPVKDTVCIKVGLKATATGGL